jgi:proline racemase
LKDRKDVTISVPGFGGITVDVPRVGAFYLIDEKNRTTAPVAAVPSSLRRVAATE